MNELLLYAIGKWVKGGERGRTNELLLEDMSG